MATDTRAELATKQNRIAPVDPVARAIWEAAATVFDPELPVLSLEDLGVLRDAAFVDGVAEVTITPTYSGCPAMDAMREDIVAALTEAGFPKARVRTVLSPAWTTDWMSDAGKAKLLEYGIAPPGPRRGSGPITLTLSVKCPRCGSLDTKEIARFGSTSCKALYSCQSCQEPFDYLKVL